MRSPSPRITLLSSALVLAAIGTVARAEPRMSLTLGSVPRNVVKLPLDGDGSDAAVHSGVCMYRAGKTTASGDVVAAEPSEVRVHLTQGLNRFVAGEPRRLAPIPRSSKAVTFSPDITPAPAFAASSPPPTAAGPAETAPTKPTPMAYSGPRATTGERVCDIPPSPMERSFSKSNAMLLASGAVQYGRTHYFGVAPGFLLKIGDRIMLGPKAFLSFYPDFNALGVMLSVESFFTEAPRGFFGAFGLGAIRLNGTVGAVDESALGVLAQAQFGYALRLTEVIGFRLGVGAFYLGKTRTTTLDLSLNPLNAQAEVGLLLFF
jgi:hypothetical protein